MMPCMDLREQAAVVLRYQTYKREREQERGSEREGEGM